MQFDESRIEVLKTFVVDFEPPDAALPSRLDAVYDKTGMVSTSAAPTGSGKHVVKLTGQLDPELKRHLDRLRELLEQRLAQLAEPGVELFRHLARLIELGAKGGGVDLHALRTVWTDHPHELCVIFEPSQFLRDLLAAAEAGELDVGTIDRIHGGLRGES